MNPQAFKAMVRQAHAEADYQAVLARMPYAQLIGVECHRDGDGLLLRLPARPENIGNPMLPAIHGGVIAGFMEAAAVLHLLVLMEAPGIPQMVDFSIDYLRTGQHRETFANCQVWRQGRRVVNVAISAWQADKAEPIATARAHFKVEPQ